MISLWTVIHLGCTDLDRNYVAFMLPTHRELGEYVDTGTVKRGKADVIMRFYSVSLLPEVPEEIMADCRKRRAIRWSRRRFHSNHRFRNQWSSGTPP
jgi:hypothetical protein